MDTISLQKTYAGKHILIIGSTGFIGKVLVSLILSKFSDVGQLYLLIRDSKDKTAQQRMDDMFKESPVFAGLRTQYGDHYENYINTHVTVVEGDLSKERLGINSEQTEYLNCKLDLVINTAGIVSFLPDLREVLAINIQGTMNVAEFSASTRHAVLLHVSTCYVAGERQGEIPEEAITNTSPNGRWFDVAQELIFIHDTINGLKEKHKEDEEIISTNGLKPRRSNLEKALVQAGHDRAKSLGWPNTYTYSKAIAEAWLVQQLPRLRLTIFRPSITECAVSFPEPGWNEGFNTCAPLCKTADSWFCLAPIKDVPLDVIPVDYVCQGMIKVGATLMMGCHCLVYQCASSGTNPLQLPELSKYTRNWYRKQVKDKSWLKRAKYATDIHRISINHPLAPGRIDKAFSHIPNSWLQNSKSLNKLKRNVHLLSVLYHFFKPFVYDYDYKFKTDELEKIKVEETDFDGKIADLNWEDYWLNVEMPGLSRWCFPLMDKRSH